MKMILGVLLLSVLFIGCGPEFMQLSGNYNNKPVEIYTEKSKEDVWNNIIEMFATKGISIKLIDKSSGLIVSEKSSFSNSFTVENRFGGLKNPKAFVVCEKIKMQGLEYEPTHVTGEWNIRVVTKGEKTLINVNLVNIETEFAGINGFRGTGRTTGVFEKSIAELLK